ncbi:MAG: hypothetical protein DMG13_15870 [Acidobacteria bacterium]|nr:MAG: hypothetical protein DMG13_15870 [Acidobacteriota bacterium]
MNQKLLPVIASCIGLLLISASLLAHHSEAAQFDVTKPIKVTGLVKRVEWMNPHIWFYVDVKDDKGNVTTWGFSGLPPGMAVRKGFTKDTLRVGETVVVQGFRAKDGSNNASGNILTFSDGRQVFPGALEVGTIPRAK